MKKISLGKRKIFKIYGLEQGGKNAFYWFLFLSNQGFRADFGDDMKSCGWIN